MEYFWKKRMGRFALFFALSYIVCICVTAVYISSRSQLEYTQMEQLAMAKSNKVSGVLTKLLYKTQILSAFVQQNDGQIENFERIASTVSDDPAIRNVLLAPDGIVSQVYPVAGNEMVLGLDLFSEQQGNREAVLARDSGQLVLGGPFQLIQGGQALVGRLPVYVGEGGSAAFWGIASVTLDYPQALNGAELDELERQGFAYEIWRVSPDTNERQSIAKSAWSSENNAKYVEYPMEVLNAKWYFRLSPIRSWYQFPETWASLFFGFLLSILVGSLMLHNYDLSQMKQELEQLSMNDALTNVPNRRGCFQILQKLTGSPPVPFVLCYLDLNYFKNINDQYGHNAGDQALKHFSSITERCLAATQHHLARVGGDEFIILFQGLQETAQAEQILLQISAALAQSSIQIYDERITLSFSVGCAAFPADGMTADELIAAADQRMYRAKRAAQIKR